MFAFPLAALLTGAFLILAGCVTIARHFLLEPVSLNYPKAPAWLRNVMFLFGAVQLYLGLRFVWVFASGAPDTIPPQPAPSTQLLALALLIYEAAMLANILRQRYPEEIWQRLNRMNDAVRCDRARRWWGRW